MKRARGMMVASMVIFGTIGLFKRGIGVSSGELALYRAVMAAAVLGVALWAAHKPLSFRAVRKQLPLLLLSGAAMGINWILLFEAFNYTSISVATLSYYFAPVLVTLVSPVLFRERMSRTQILCFVISTLGLVLVIGVGGFGEGSSDLKGILFGLGAACFYAMVMLLNKFIKGVEGLHRTLLQFLAAIITILPYVALTTGCSLGGLDAAGWVCLIVVGVVHTGLAYCLYFPAVGKLPGQTAAILSYVDPLVAVLASVLILRETMSVGQWIGGALILGATLWNELKPNKAI